MKAIYNLRNYSSLSNLFNISLPDIKEIIKLISIADTVIVNAISDSNESNIDIPRQNIVVDIINATSAIVLCFNNYCLYSYKSRTVDY